MKSKCSFILKASTALVLALLMLFGTVTTSVAAVVDNAKNTAEADAAESEAHGAEGFFAALRRNTPDLADTGKNADLAETGAGSLSTLPAGMKVYFKLNTSKWNNPSTVYAYFFTTTVWSSKSGEYTRVTSTKNSDGFFTATVPNDGKTYKRVQFRSSNSVSGGNYSKVHAPDYVWNNTVWDDNSGNWNDFTTWGSYSTKKTNSQGKIYFDNSVTQWTGNIYLVVARATDSWYFRADKMTADSDAPDIYYYSMSSTFSDGYTAIGFANGGSNTISSGSDGSTFYNKATNKTTWISDYAINNASSTYVGTPTTSGSDVGYSLDYRSSTFNYFDSTYTLYSGAGGSAKIDGFQFTAHGTATANSQATASASGNTTMTIAKSSTVTVTPVPNTGYRLKSVTLDSKTGTALTAGSGGTYTYKADGSAHSIYVEYEQITHTVSRSGSAPSNGTIKFSTDNSTWSDGPITVAEGASYYVKATPNTGYKISSFTVGGSAVSGASGSTSAKTYTGTMSTSDVTASASFAIRTIYVRKTETGASGGTVKVGSTTIGTSNTSVNYGTNYTVTVDAPTGYKVTAVSGISGTTSGLGTNSVTITGVSITAAKTIAVTYVSAGTCAFDPAKTSTTLTIGSSEAIAVNPNSYHSGTISVSSSNTSVATASYSTSTGKVTINAVDDGDATITISCNDTGSTSATIEVEVSAPTVSFNQTTKLTDNIGTTVNTRTATGSTIGSGATSTLTYSSSDTSIATVNSSTGVVTRVGAGTATITATYIVSVGGTEKARATATYQVGVNAPTITVGNKTGLKIGESYTPSPTLTNPSATGSGWTVVYSRTSGTYSTTDGSTITGDTYNSSATTFKASYQYNGVEKASATFTVETSDPTITFNSTAQTINVGATVTKTATGDNIGSGATGTISYSSGNTAIATVSSSGVVTGVTPGTTSITATYTVKIGNTVKATKTASYNVTVNTPVVSLSGNAKVAVGNTITLTPSVTNVTGTPTYTYSSSAASKASVTNAGVVTGVAAGTATITVTATLGDWSDTATKEITVEAPDLTVDDGSTSVINETVYTTTGTNKSLTVGKNFTETLYVKSSNEDIATVSLDGNTLTITPRAKGTCKVSVSTSNSVTPQNANLAQTAAAMPQGLLRKVLEIAATGAVATQTAQFTVNVAEADTYSYLYFTNGVGWSTPKAYLWQSTNTNNKNANYPGEAMVKIGKNENNQDVYAIRYLTSKGYNRAIINDGSDSKKVNIGGTTDLTLGTHNAVWCNTANTNNTTSAANWWDCTIVKPQIQASNVTIDMGGTQTMTATVLTSGTPSTFNWSSGTASVATTADTHTASNVITGVAPGTSTITIKAYAEKPTGWTSIVTDGTADNYVAGTTTATATVVAENKTITYRAKYSDDGSTWNNATASQGTFTVKNGNTAVTSGASLAYNTNLTLTATPVSGYAVEGIYKSTDNGTTWTKVTGSTLTLNDNYLLEARFIKVYKLSAFDSYEMKNNQVTFVTAPPKSITIKHTDAHGTATTYTYSYDGTKTAGNPDSPDGSKPAALAIATGQYGQGNYIQYYAGDEITLTYSAMASSEILKGVFYDNTKNFYVAKPTSGQFIAHSHPSTPAIYMNGAYYTSAQLGNRTFTGVTADNDAHSIKFTGTQDYKNIDVEIGTKRKVYFSDYTNAIIGSKNTDDYYADDEALSETTGTNPKQLTVKAAKSATQTNTITASNIRFYKANADGTKGEEVSRDTLGITIIGTTSTSSSSSDGAELVFNGNMPAYDLYIDLNMQNSYTLKLGTKVVSSLGEANVNYLKQKANTISIAGSTTLNANTNGYVTPGTTSVNTGTTATLSVTGLASGYMFVGWYWGDASGPDYDKGFISDKATLSYAPKKGGIIWAVGTKDLFINGSKYITGKNTDWYSENNAWKNQKMKFDPDRGEQGSYYWEITDTMFASAGNDFKYTTTTGTSTTEGRYYKGGDNRYYWNGEADTYHGKAFFQFIDTETGYDSRTVWSQVWSFVETADGTTHGKIYPVRNDGNDYTQKNLNGQGFIDFAESRYSGYSSPLRIYLDAATKDLDVVATPILSNLYVSNGYNVGSTLKTDAVTVQPVVDGVVKTSGQTGYFAINPQGSGWDPDHEGHVSHYIPQKKGATVRITKEARGSDKIAAFLIYDIDNKTVRAEKNITKGTTANSKTPYYIDLTLANERQNLYIVPIVEEADAKVTITFDATQLNRAQWGDIVTAYSWYQGSNNDGLGEYPGQPMIPSDDMSTWTTSFPTTKGGKKLAGITFTNYVDGIHSWLGCSGVMGEASDHKTGTATGGIINVYNHVYSGDTGEYSRTNYKAQTYDYHEPIALYDRYKNEGSVNITFQMKDGNSTLISWYHKDLVNTSNNILNPSQEKWRLNFEYLTNAKGDQYIDMNGNPLGANNKPTATFYVASKGLAVYKNSTMKYIFDSGQNYEMQGYEAKYTRGTGDTGTYTRQSGGWSSAITYGGVTGLDMKYAVQWYVYDAQGNYITTVLSAGIADLASGSTDTYIAKQLENMGYAVDGKSVAICYDKPRYMYGDWDNVTNSANNINSGPNFDAYRFEGQWIAAAQTDTVKVNVGVGMMTDSGEVLANSNTAAYGNATASLRSGITFGKQNYAIVADDGSWAQTAATDAKLNGIVLNASKQNFIGWYYYDANTGDFVKANYTSNEDFYPNYSNKDVTYYAIYRAAAVYNYIYQGREGERTYSAVGEDLIETELSDNKVVYNYHSADVLNNLPVGIGVFKENIDFSASKANSWTKNNDTQYILKLSGFEVTLPTYTLTAHYIDANGDPVTISDKAVYNGMAVNLTTGTYEDSKRATKPAGTPVTSYKPGFIGWYEYNSNNDTIGELLSTQANYGMRLTKHQHVIAVYKDDNITLPTDGWKAYIDENEVNKELTTEDTGVFYNDTIVRVRNGSDVKATLPNGAKIGVLVVTKPNGVTTTKEPGDYNDTQLGKLVNSITSGDTKSTNSGLIVTNMQATTQTSFNRTDIAVRADYAKTLGAKYCVYAYIYDGSTYHFSAASDVKTYE